MEEEEASKSLPIESFSYSWLVNFPSLESLFNSSRRLSLDTCGDDSSSSSSFIEMDPRLPPSKRFLIGSQESFKFDFPGKNESIFHHADELFRDGYVMPLQETDPSSYTLSSNNSIKLETLTAGAKSKASRKYRRLSRRMLMKYLEFLTPLCGKQRKVESRMRGATKNRVYSEQSVAFSADDWRRSCDSESSIYEAVLHCKKSFEK